MQEFSTDAILDLAFAAHRVNNGYVKNTQRFSENKPTVFSNKELVTYTAYSSMQDTDSGIHYWIPDDFVPLVVTDKDLDSKAAADNHMRRYTMLALGKLSDFESDIFTAYSSENVPLNRLGLIAYIPEFVARELKEKEYKLRLKTDFASSAKINLHTIQDNTVEILKKIPLINYETNLYIGAIDKDLVAFTMKDILETDAEYYIRARVKGYDTERDTGLPMTRLNYVKVKKVTQ